LMPHKQKAEPSQSLKEFAAMNPARPKKCAICVLPQVKEINEAREAGITIKAMQHWLVKQHGHNIEALDYNKFSRHFGRGHHLA
jgi:hypothetical protein